MPTRLEPTITISAETARRYVLGRQGIWPGRHWQSSEGTRQAIMALGSVQMDPLTIVARSHDLVLWNRVAGYRQGDLVDALYERREAFDYGGVLAALPIEELPYWRPHMARRMDDPKFAELLADTGDLVDDVRRAVREDGPMTAREIAAAIAAMDRPGRAVSGARARGSYRSKSPVNQLAYHLWLTGELMTSHREGFERVFDLAERIAPAEALTPSPDADTELHFGQKALRTTALLPARYWRDSVAYALHRRLEADEAAAWRKRLVADGDAIVVAVDGLKGERLAPAGDRDALATLAAGSYPDTWVSRGQTTREVARLLSPLDRVVAGNRYGDIFDFSHIWEIYKPAAKRAYGPYTMPVLFDDMLVGRLDAKLDRDAGAVTINGIWLEDETQADEGLLPAVAEGVREFAAFPGAATIDPGGARGSRVAVDFLTREIG